MIKMAIFVYPNYPYWKISAALELMKYWIAQLRWVLNSSNKHCLRTNFSPVSIGDFTGIVTYIKQEIYSFLCYAFAKIGSREFT